MRLKALILLQVSLLALVVSTNADIWSFFNSMSLNQGIDKNQQFLLSTSPAYPPAGAPSSHHHHQHHHHSHHANPLPHSPLTQPQIPAKSPMMMPPPGHHHHHHHQHLKSPSMAPAHSPMMPPTTMPPAHSPMTPPTTMPPHSPHVKPPAQAPGHQPVGKAPPRMLVAVQGVVYCKSCNSSGVSTLSGAAPLEGVRVVMKCRNTVYTTKTIVVTDKNGYFVIQPPKTVTTYGVHKCRVALASPPLKSPCKKPTMLNDGLLGSLPVPVKNQSSHENFAMYTVGPFAYEPVKGHCSPKQ